METKEVTITYQPTEPMRSVYIMTVFWKDEDVVRQELSFKTIHSNIDSLLKFQFTKLNYERWEFNDEISYIPTKEQPLHFLKNSKFGENTITRVEIQWCPLYL